MCPFFPGQLKLPVTTGLNIRRAKDKNEGGKKAQKNRSKNYFKKEGSIRKKKKEGGERAKSKNSKVFGKIVVLKQKFLNNCLKKGRRKEGTKKKAPTDSEKIRGRAQKTKRQARFEGGLSRPPF